jgi:hypothetical protein
MFTRGCVLTPVMTCAPYSILQMVMDDTKDFKHFMPALLVIACIAEIVNREPYFLILIASVMYFMTPLGPGGTYTYHWL